VDYLVVGHWCEDITPGGLLRHGGSVAYAGLAADALGCRSAVVTSAARDGGVRRALAGLQLRLLAAARSTRFENRRGPGGWREQRLYARALPLHAGHIPKRWRRPGILHLAPVAGEVDPGLLTQCEATVKGLTPQGWLRGWDAAGRIYPRRWPLAEAVFAQADAVVLSEEDLDGGPALEVYRRSARLLVVTQGRRGCTVFRGRQARSFTAPAVIERDASGAGDIFAAAFFIALLRSGNPWEAARQANSVAAPSVAQADLEAKIGAVRSARPVSWGPMAARCEGR
jgi:hypothetical protein